MTDERRPNEEALRIAKTEALFRDVNERIAETAQRIDLDEVEFVCECADVTCTDRVGASLDDYEAVRESPRRFLLVAGHEDEQIERVIARRRRYHIVEKVHNVVAAHVTRLDPRADAA